MNSKFWENNSHKLSLRHFLEYHQGILAYRSSGNCIFWVPRHGFKWSVVVSKWSSTTAPTNAPRRLQCNFPTDPEIRKSQNLDVSKPRKSGLLQRTSGRNGEGSGDEFIFMSHSFSSHAPSFCLTSTQARIQDASLPSWPSSTAWALRIYLIRTSGCTRIHHVLTKQFYGDLKSFCGNQIPMSCHRGLVLLGHFLLVLGYSSSSYYPQRLGKNVPWWQDNNGYKTRKATHIILGVL